MDEWISVDDRLPHSVSSIAPHSEWVLCFHIYGAFSVAMYIPDILSWDFGHQVLHGKVAEITHWMPLPHPPAT